MFRCGCEIIRGAQGGAFAALNPPGLDLISAYTEDAIRHACSHTSPTKRVTNTTRARLMGASNAIAAFTKYAGKVPPQSLNVLVYMALVSKDSDERPWYGQGHAALAQHALGRPGPSTESDIRAVERAVAPLLGDALIVERKAAVRIDGPNTVRYRLNLTGTAHARRKVSDVKGAEDPPRPTKSDPHVRHFPDSRPTVSGTHARHKPWDRGDTRRHEELKEEDNKDLGADVAVVAASEDIDETPIDCPLPVKCPHGLTARRLANGTSSCALCRRAERSAASPNVIPFRRPA